MNCYPLEKKNLLKFRNFMVVDTMLNRSVPEKNLSIIAFGLVWLHNNVPQQIFGMLLVHYLEFFGRIFCPSNFPEGQICGWFIVVEKEEIMRRNAKKAGKSGKMRLCGIRWEYADHIISQSRENMQRILGKDWEFMRENARNAMIRKYAEKCTDRTIPPAKIPLSTE